MLMKYILIAIIELFNKIFSTSFLLICLFLNEIFLDELNNFANFKNLAKNFF